MASVEKGLYQLYEFKRYIFVRAQLPETDNINNARATLPVLFGATAAWALLQKITRVSIRNQGVGVGKSAKTGASVHR